MKKNIKLLFLFFCMTYSFFGQHVLMDKYDLMPWPKKIIENSGSLIIDENLTISINGNDNSNRVLNASTNFLRRLSDRTGIFLEEGFPITSQNGTIKITFDETVKLGIDTDESYTLVISKYDININAKTDVGAIRGLASLLQLTQNNETNYYFPCLYIEDVPRFVWRGLLIDVSRHFQPINVLKRNLDAMASLKMNVFHWHLTDDQGFRIESKIYPKLQELASDYKYYTQEQIKDLVAYADRLGIRVVPEIDVPGHASALLTAYPELGSKDGLQYSIERFAGVFDPTLDPTKEKTYTFLKNLFSEIAPLFPDDYFHIGGDENEGKHWNENKNIQSFKRKHDLKSNHELQNYFNVKLENILSQLGKKLMGWDEILTPNTPKTAVIHSWRGKHEGLQQSTLIEASKKGYQTVLSAGYYIDRMLPIEHHYSIDPIGGVKLSSEERDRILGGEATMWGELVTPLTIDSRIWPRTAAIAERFWSQQEIKNVSSMKKRLKKVSYNLEALGIKHIIARDVILRNICNNQDITPLLTLSRICEPLKWYERNKGGIEYKSFSPFMLFADACVVNAKDAETFNTLVKRYLKKPDYIDSELLHFLKTWSKNHQAFLLLEKNPKISPIEQLSESLSKTSEIITRALKSKTLNKLELNVLKTHINTLSKPHADVEVTIIEALRDLTQYCATNYLKEPDYGKQN